MHDAVMGRFAAADAVIMAAAVADFRPKAPSIQKLKKADGVPEFALEPTTDILAALGRAKAPGQVVVGFAAETERLREHAAAKLAGKRVDLMVANDVSAPDAGFEVDTNRALVVGRRRRRRGDRVAHQGAAGGRSSCAGWPPCWVSRRTARPSSMRESGAPSPWRRSEVRE